MELLTLNCHCPSTYRASVRLTVQSKPGVCIHIDCEWVGGNLYNCCWGVLGYKVSTLELFEVDNTRNSTQVSCMSCGHHCVAVGLVVWSGENATARGRKGWSSLCKVCPRKTGSLVSTPSHSTLGERDGSFSFFPGGGGGHFVKACL